MLCLGRVLLKAETIVNSFLLNFFVSPSIFLPCACSVPPWAKPGLWCVLDGAWATWAHSFASALTCPVLVRDIASLLSSALPLFFMGETPLTNSLLWHLECFQMGSAANLPACKTGTASCSAFFFFFCQVSYVTENMFIDHLQNLEIENSVSCVVFLVRYLKCELSASSLYNPYV